MGAGSKKYCVYYGCLTFIYFGLMVTGFTLFGMLAGTGCTAKCPLSIVVSQDGVAAGLNYGACQCPPPFNISGFPNNELPPTQSVFFNRYQQIKAITGTQNNPSGINCYICSSPGDSTVYIPCDEFDQCPNALVPGFTTATINSTQTCNSRGVPDPPLAEILQSNTVLNRGTLSNLILFFGIFFLLQTITFLIVFIAYFGFRDKYSSDWGKLTPQEKNLGGMAKLLPSCSRIINWAIAIIILIGAVLLFTEQVCMYDTNGQNQVVFYPLFSGYIIAMIVVWLLFCIGGSLFHRCVVRDTSFHNPPFPPPEGEGCGGKTARIAWELITGTGP